MEVLYFLIPLSLLFVAIAVGFFFWAVKSGQYEDMEGPAYRILFDDDQPVSQAEESGDNRSGELQRPGADSAPGKPDRQS